MSAWPSNYIYHTVREEIIYSFRNSNGPIDEVWIREVISSHTLLGTCLLSFAEITVNSGYLKGTWSWYVFEFCLTINRFDFEKYNAVFDSSIQTFSFQEICVAQGHWVVQASWMADMLNSPCYGSHDVLWHNLWYRWALLRREHHMNELTFSWALRWGTPETDPRQYDGCWCPGAYFAPWIH